MNVLCIYAFIKSLHEEEKRKLLKHGWSLYQGNKDYYSKEIDKFSLSLVSLSFAEQIICSLRRGEEVIRYVDCNPFDFLEGWNQLWSRNILLEEVHFFTMEDVSDKLLNLGWERNDDFPDIVQYEGFFLRKREDSQVNKYYFEFQDATPCKALEYPERLKQANLL